eukprot:scaffold250607_cov16-Tisochrysis_lutea.AAC.1
MLSSKLQLSRLHHTGRPLPAPGFPKSTLPRMPRAACKAHEHSQQHLSDKLFLMSPLLLLQAVAATQARAEEAASTVEGSSSSVDVSIPAATELAPGQLVLLFRW